MKRSFSLLLLLLCLSARAHGQAGYSIAPPVPNGTLYVCTYNGPPMPAFPCPIRALIYTTSALTTPITQPVSLGAGGTQTFYALYGQYVVQIGVGGSLSQQFVLSMPAPLPPGSPGGAGAVSSVFTRTGAVVATSGDYTASQVPGAGLQGIFYISTACGGNTNCLQWVDDDSTDNCGTATTAFMALINGYSGPGKAQVFIGGSGSSTAKAYKLASCSLAFTTNPGVTVDATIDCAQTANNCFSFAAGNFVLTGTGTFVGGANLVNAGVEVLANANGFMITGVKFSNFGAGNATLGNCTNYAILVDSPVAQGYIGWTTYLSGTAGTCAYANPSQGSGTNTIYFADNVIGWPGNVGASTCGSIGILDGGSYGAVTDNLIYGAGMDIRIQGNGHRLVGNELDSANCVAKTKNAAIHFGANGSSAVIDGVTVSNNNVQAVSGHTLNFIAQAGDSTATIQNWALIGNQSNIFGGAEQEGLFDASYNCAINTTTQTLCYEYGNTSLTPLVTCGTTNTGWQFENLLAGCASAAQTANLANTLLLTPAFIKLQLITCEVVLTSVGTTSTLPQCVISFTDFDSNHAQSITLTPVWASGTVGCSGSATNTVGNSCTGSALILPKNAVAVNYSTTGYASTGTAMQYIVRVRAVAQ